MSGTVLAGQELTSSLLGVPPWLPMASTGGGYLNSWSDSGSGAAVGQYRKWPLLNSVEVIGQLAHTSVSGVSQFFQLPAGYTPASSQVFAAIGGSVSGNLVVAIDIAASGSVSVASANAVTFIQFHGWISLDA